MECARSPEWDRPRRRQLPALRARDFCNPAGRTFASDSLHSFAHSFRYEIRTLASRPVIRSVSQSMACSPGALISERGPDQPGAGWEHERKFVTPSRSLLGFLPRVASRTTLDVHDTARPVTWNRTTYLDTHDFAYLRSTRPGGIARKLRVREYASAPSALERPRLSGLCYLELKETGGTFRSKTRVRVEPGLLLRMLERPDFAKAELSPTVQAFQRLLLADRPVPKLTTWYRRITRVSSDRSLRITIDSDICFAEPMIIGLESALSAAPPSPIGRVPFSVVEVKSGGDLPGWLRDALAPLHEVQEFSKFRRGMAALLGGAR